MGRALRTDSRKKKPSFRNQLTTIIVVKSHTHTYTHIFIKLLIVMVVDNTTTTQIHEELAM